MPNKEKPDWSRRGFLRDVSVAGAAALFGLSNDAFASEPPPETTKLRLIRSGPRLYTVHRRGIAARRRLLRHQEVRKEGGGIPARIQALGAGEGDILSTYIGPLLARIDTGDPIVILSGLHVGCLQLFATERIRTIRDLKGRTVAISEVGSAGHYFLASLASYVGLNPAKDIHWVTHSSVEAIRLLAEGKIDAYQALPPDPLELRAKRIGHVVVNSALDRPWSQYFCCMVAANREFVRKNPAATKRALRAIMKTVDICALEPERSTRFLVDKGYTKNYDFALGTLKEIPYGKWREFDPEDTVRFYSLRLNEIGMIRSGPQKIISQGTDWRFLRELKKELKA